MDYRAVLLLPLVVFAAALAWMLLRTRKARPRKERAGGQRGTAWEQVDVRWAVIALIFVAFDMEMIYMFPWAVAYQQVGKVAFWDMLVFAVVLLVGLAYAYKRGGFSL